MLELNERARQILHAVVTEFIETGEPVGSRTLSKKFNIDLSPASIRNVLSDLEDLGLLYQPHTSAGRVPTERAFRVFIDGLMQWSALSGHEQAEIHAIDGLSPGFDMLNVSGRILSELAGMASVVLAPRNDTRRLSQLHFIVANPSQNTMLAVLLFSDGMVENRFFKVEALPTDSQVERSHNVLKELVCGRSLHEVRDMLAARLSSDLALFDESSRKAMELAMLATEPRELERPTVVIHGQSRLLEQPDFRSAESLRPLVQALEERERLLSLLDKTIDASTVQVLVGKEAGNLADGSVSLVLAPFAEAGRSVGTIGVLGPRRMNYPRVVPLVSATATAVSAVHDRAVECQDDECSARKGKLGLRG